MSKSIFTTPFGSSPYVGIEEAKIENTGALLENVSRGIKREQVLREHVVNALDADATIVDVDVCHKRQKRGIFKLVFRDNGLGMSAEQIRAHINAFSQFAVKGDHFGVGGRLTALFWNTLGLVFRTFTSPDEGTEAVMIYQNGKIGLAETEDEEGDADALGELTRRDMHPEARKAGHGTEIILEGNEIDDNTYLPPEGMLGGTWAFTRYLNHHFFKPIRNSKGQLAKVRVRRFTSPDPKDWPHKVVNRSQNGAEMRTIRAMYDILKGASEQSGDFVLEDLGVKFHWFLLKKHQKRDFAWKQKPAAHIAALNGNELFHHSFGVKALRDFGLRMVGCRTVIYVEPFAAKQDITRQTLVINNRPIPLGKYRKAFGKNMPAALRKADLEEINNRASTELSGTDTNRVFSLIEKMSKLFPSYKDFIKSAKGNVFVETLEPKKRKPGKSGKHNQDAPTRKKKKKR